MGTERKDSEPKADTAALRAFDGAEYVCGNFRKGIQTHLITVIRTARMATFVITAAAKTIALVIIAPIH